MSEYSKASGLKVGDKVIVTRRAESYANGWSNCWLPEKDKSIGKTFTILEDHQSHGFVLDDGNDYHYPYFILQKVYDIEQQPKIPIKIGDQTFNLPQCIINML